MESSHKAGIVKPSEWILLLFATVLLGAAFSSQRATLHKPVVPVEAKIDIPVDESVPVLIDSQAAFELEAGSETQVAAVMLSPNTTGLAQPALKQDATNSATESKAVDINQK